MKLLCCVRCSQIFGLRLRHYQECEGGHGGGLYLDDVNIVIWGPRELVVVLGFANSSFVDAVRIQIREGDRDAQMRYHGKWVPVGRDFEAFVVPEASDSLQRYSTRNEFADVVQL